MKSGRLIPWLALAVVIACGFSALAGCGDGGDTPSTPATEVEQDPKPSPDPAPFDPLDIEDEGHKFPTAKQCGACHTEIYEEWKQSYHGRAMSDPLFLEFSAEVNKEECIRCHAPEPLRVVGFETPIARAERREDAVSCLTCHQMGGGENANRVAGPGTGRTGACNPVHDPAQTDPVKMCFICHNQHDTGNEWLRGPYSPTAEDPREKPVTTCLDCHMPEVTRPIVKGGVPRKGRRHTWPGGHSLPQLKKAAKVEAEVTALADGGVSVRAYVTNVGAGHNIPTDARHRSFDVYVKMVEDTGRVLLDPLDFEQQAKTLISKYRLQYRNSGLKDTQIAPGQRVSGLGRHKGALDVPEATQGTGELWLVYRLTPRDVLKAESFNPKDPHDLGNSRVAVVVEVVKFTYGK